MLSVAISVLAFIAVTAAVVIAGRFVPSGASRGQHHTLRRLRELGGDAGDPEPKEDAGRLSEVTSRVAGWLVPKSSERVANLRERLALAGYREPSTLLYFVGAQLFLVVTLMIAFGGVTTLLGVGWVRVLMWGSAGGAIGLVAPTLILKSLVSRRQRTIRNALPDALDVMVLSVEGGASLNAAVSWAAEELRDVHPLLGEELVTIQREIHLGMSVGEAFAAFADRCGISEARDLAAAILQSERYGASVSTALRTYADAARQDRQMWAEEVAQKAAVKIIFPMLLCIFPAIFIVLLGPAAMQMSQLFSR